MLTEINFDARQVRQNAFDIRLYGAARASLDRGPCPDAGNMPLSGRREHAPVRTQGTCPCPDAGDMEALETISAHEIKVLLGLGAVE
jgi:hypothetical protein